MYVLLFLWHNQNWRFWLPNILIDKESYENILVYNISWKSLIGTKPLCVRFDKIDGFIRVYAGTSYLTLKNMMLFTIGLDIL